MNAFDPEVPSPRPGSPSQPDIGEFSVDGEQYARVPSGEYELAFVDHSTQLLYGKQPKLRLNFRIITMCKANGIVLTRWYNVEEFIGKPGRSGRFRCGRGSSFLFEAALCIGWSGRKDRTPMSHWHNHVFVGRVETVKKNYKQRTYPEVLQYSVIRELLGVKK